MSRLLAMWMGLVMGVCLLCQAPAAFYLERIDWSPGWRPQAISGTLWDGRIERLGPWQALAWQLRPWAGNLQVSAALAGQGVQARFSGWPWQWHAWLGPHARTRVDSGAWQLGGDWQGAVQVQGRGLSCTRAQGQVSVTHLAVVTPWSLALGDGELHLLCSSGRLGLAGTVQAAGQHRLELQGDFSARRLQLSGQLEPEATLLAPLAQVGWTRDGQRHFSRTARW